MSDGGNDRQPIDRLLEESRVLGATRVIRDPDVSKVTAEQAAAVMEHVKAFIARTNVSRAYVARAIGVGAMAITDVALGRYQGNWRQVIADLDRFLEDEAKRDAAPKPTAFVWTKVAEEIRTVAEAACSLRTIGLVYGPSGIGKSLTLQAVAAEKPGSVLVSIETAAATGPGLIDALGKALRAYSGPRYVSSRYILERVKDALAGAPRLLIIDEVHKLCTGTAASDDRVLTILRDLHDHTGAPMLLCGTTDVVAYLERKQAKGREPLSQIRRRIGICRDLTERVTGDDGGPGEPLFSAEEVRRVFARSKMRLAPDAARYLTTLANLPDSGSLGTCRNLVVMATKVHERAAGGALTADMLRGVHRLLVNRRAYVALEGQIQQQSVRAVAKAG